MSLFRTRPSIKKGVEVIWLSNILALNVPSEGYSKTDMG